jgi:hypothetical protein
MPELVTDPRVRALRERYHRLYRSAKLPVPVQAVAEDSLALFVEGRQGLDVSALLAPAERKVVVKADESEARCRFILPLSSAGFARCSKATRRRTLKICPSGLGSKWDANFEWVLDDSRADRTPADVSAGGREGGVTRCRCKT